jgi:hypothetical protein
MITKIIIKGVVHGLNGKHGLIREHYRTAKMKKDLYTTLIKGQTKNKHTGKVIIRYIGYKIVLMDWDNFAASFKHIGDSLVAAGVIVDDKPAIVTEFLPNQIKISKRDQQRIEVIIEDV